MSNHKKRRWPWVVGVIVFLLAAALIYNHWPTYGPAITVSRETTYLTEPLNDDGTVNYFRAVVEAEPAGVTFENNAVVSLAQAFGPSAFSEYQREELLAALDLTHDPLVRNGPHFQYFGSFVRERFPDHARGDPRPSDMLRDAKAKPWRTEDYPLLAAWLDTNAAPLQQVIEASARSRFYIPLIPSGDDEMLWDAFQSYHFVRGTTEALIARAMLRGGEGDTDGAIDDLLAAHALARLVSHASSSIQWTLGCVLSNQASEATQDLIAEIPLTAEQARRMLDGLNALPPLRDIATMLQGQRLFWLDAMTALVHGKLSMDESSPGPLPRKSVDWDVIFTEFNDVWDRQEAAYRVADLTDRHLAIEAFTGDYYRQYGGEGLQAAIRRGQLLAIPSKIFPRFFRQSHTRALATVIVAIYATSDIERIAALGQMTEAHLAMDRLGLALVIHRQRRGQYPDSLSALAPDILDSIPTRPANGTPFIYERSETGCRLDRGAAHPNNLTLELPDRRVSDQGPQERTDDR